ncbi:hypothetical protein [Chryseobacterium oncorhynchi]|uniref:Uncharacterized protein n=1 Tax=Chryseobacterium oncorhynchi TaxID=741074 RepID=A0A316X9R3_9FLAO|nr:hypothetical protein [Chryseobacterium oncorhynchi]PWN67590.1 hypothetical protein C1638_003090 [Chryseobacterium oncorhynchi]
MSNKKRISKKIISIRKKNQKKISLMMFKVIVKTLEYLNFAQNIKRACSKNVTYPPGRIMIRTSGAETIDRASLAYYGNVPKLAITEELERRVINIIEMVEKNGFNGKN